MGGRPLHHHDGPEPGGRPSGMFDRIVGHRRLLHTAHPRHFSGVGSQDGAVARQSREPFRRALVREGRCVDHDADLRLGLHQCERQANGVVGRQEPRADDQRIGVAGEGGQSATGPTGQFTVRRRRRENDPRFRKSQPERRSQRPRRCQGHPPGAHAKRGFAGQPRRPRHRCAACNDESRAAVVLVLLFRRRRQGQGRHGRVVERQDRHRAATGASGAVVTAAPSSLRGATKL